jgi:1-acyl-sn-glycerol-3-phosphate acyltransferase
MGIFFRFIESDYRLFYKHGYNFALAMLRLSGIELRVEGYEQLDEHENYVFVANHVSVFDIPAIWVAVGKAIRIRILYKYELQHVPLFGWAMKSSPFIPIRRERPRDGMSSLNDAAEKVQSGSSVVVFAEGTRSRTGQLLPFKRGAFMLAARSGKRIVPVAIIGSQKILQADKLLLRPGMIRIVIGEPIPQPDQHDRNAERDLMQRVHSVIAAALPADMVAAA